MWHTRSEWAQREPLGPLPWNYGKRFVVVHWTAVPDAADPGTTEDKLRAMETYHMDARGGWAIFYNFVVDQDGDVWAGRGWDMRGGAQGVVDSDRQDVSISAILGPGETPTPAMLDALNGFRVEAVQRGWDAGVRGHKDFKQKACPGPDLYAWVQSPKEDTMLTPEQEAWLIELIDTVTAGGGNPRSLNYNLEFYRRLAGRQGVGGNHPNVVADNVALLADVNTSQEVADAIADVASDANAAKAIAANNRSILEKVRAVLP